MERADVLVTTGSTIRIGSPSPRGDSGNGGSGAPTGSGFTAIYSTYYAFAALTADGSISAWGLSSNGGSGAPTGSGFTAIYSTYTAFAALTEGGAISVWGDSSNGGSGKPIGAGFTLFDWNSYDMHTREGVVKRSR